MAKKKNNAGRKKILIDWERVDELLVKGCNGVVVANALGIHPDTLYNAVKQKYKMDFSAYRLQKRAKTEEILNETLWEEAIEKRNITALIFLYKQVIGERSKKQEIEMTIKNLPNPEKIINELTKEELIRLANGDFEVVKAKLEKQ